MASKSKDSLSTRSRVASSSVSTTSSVKRRARLSQLKAAQAKRAVEEAVQAIETRKMAAAAAAEAEAQLVLEQARAEARKAADAAAIDALELKLIEEEELDSAQSCRALEAFERENSSPDIVEQRRTSDDDTPDRGPAVELRRAPGEDDPSARTRSWIASLPRRHTGQQASPALPKVTLDKFGGSALEWPRWIGLFKALVHDNAALTDTERLTHLQSCLIGEAREAVRGLLCDGQFYEEALCELEKQFGEPAAVVRCALDSVMKLPPVAADDLNGLTRLSRSLHVAVCTLRCYQYHADLAATTNLREVLAKLPMNLAWQWGQAELELPGGPATMADLDEWLRKVVLAGRRVLAEPSAIQSASGRRRERQMGGQARQNNHAPAGNSRESQRTTLSTQDASRATSLCVACMNGTHELQECRQFQAMSVAERHRLIRERKRCFRCLGEGHWAQQCRRRSLCEKDGCCGRHHKLLHAPDAVKRETTEVVRVEDPRSVMATNTEPERSQVTALLQVVPVRIHGENGAHVDTCALLDSGADTSLCAEHVLRRLSITGPTQELRLNNVEETGERKTSMRVSLQISPIAADGETERVTVREAFSVPKLNVRSQRVDWRERSKWKHLSGIEIPDTNDRPVELLLGANVLEAMLQKEARVGPQGQPAAIRTHFGWCLTGNLKQMLPIGAREVLHIQRERPQDTLTKTMEEWWSTEAFGTSFDFRAPRSVEDTQAEQLLEKTTRWRGDRYETGLLWRAENIKLPDNYGMALRRLENTEKGLRRQPEKAAAYRRILQEYVEDGCARKLTDAENQQRHDRCWYLPHHAVTSQNKLGKIRVVFDAAARYGGTSLNDNLLTGPDFLLTIPGVLMRFRQEAVALNADIEKMFLQVGVKTDDQPALRFLWRNMDSTRTPDIYQMDRVIFGARSSPASANYVLKRTALDKCSDSVAGRAAAAIVRANFYMDDLATSQGDLNTALTTVSEVSALVSRGGFHLRKWLSNRREVLDAIPTEERAAGAADLQRSLPTEKVLGVMWDAEQDSLFISSPSEVAAETATKRSILQVVASVYDPLGLVSPFMLIAKLILQDLWSAQLGWDEPLSLEESRRWAAWSANLPQLSAIAVPRWYGSGEEPRTRQLHLFCDASERAFGAVAFLRQVYPNGQVHCSLVMGRCRVAPLKKLSIVRLETQAAVMAVRLACCVKGELTLEINETVFWSDSQVVLGYITNSSRRFHTFIANRVAEVRSASEPSQWRFVPGEVNPADDCTRGRMVSELMDDCRWLRGPDFLWQAEDEWPKEHQPRVVSQEDPEVKTALATQSDSVVPEGVLPDPSRFSSWSRYRRTTAWMLRFCRNLKTSISAGQRNFGPLSASELQQAEALIVRQLQMLSFRQEVAALTRGAMLASSSRLLTLSPWLDDDGFLRVGGRLERAPVSEGARHPLILPRDSRVTALLIMATHEKLMHTGVDHVLNDLRQKYWIPRARETVRRTLNGCVSCRRRRARPCEPRMAELPVARFDTRRGFSSVGIDFFGPLVTRTERSNSRHKRYCLLITCLTTRAVHLEVAQSLTTDSFLMALRRFIARRGRPNVIYSDNGTNLRAGERELRQLLGEWNQQAISDRLSQEDIIWRFNPPGAADMGGVWERMIGTVKRALRTVLGRLIVTDEVLQTVVAEAEAVVNSRPLTYVSTDADSLEALTPNHLLIGAPTLCLPPGVFRDSETSSRRLWRQTQALANQFWRRWLREYVPGLIYRQKWNRDTKNLENGDLVLLVEDDVPRGRWPLGRVVEVIPGQDGRVRSARIRVRGGEVHRSARRLCLLEEDNV